MAQSLLTPNAAHTSAGPTMPGHGLYLRAFAELAGIAPADVHGIEPSHQAWEPAIQLGYAARITEGCDLRRTRARIRRLFNRLASWTPGERLPDSACFSELLAAACLLDLGMVSIREVPETPACRTVDFEATWPGPLVVEIEVTSKRRPRTESRVFDRARALAQRIVAARTDGLLIPITCYVASLDNDSHREIVAAARRLSPSSPAAERPGSWRLAVGGPRSPSDLTPPEWWRDELPLQLYRFSFESLPLLWIGCAVPTRPYMRAIARKATRSQASGERPFIVAHDCRELCNGVLALRARVAEALGDPLYSRIDGVLLYKLKLTPYGKLAWIWDLVPNPNAQRLPASLLAARPTEDSWTRPLATYYYGHVSYPHR